MFWFASGHELTHPFQVVDYVCHRIAFNLKRSNGISQAGSWSRRILLAVVPVPIFVGRTERLDALRPLFLSPA
jgi:hypothetical protein